MIEAGEITEDQAKMGYVGAYTYAEVISGSVSYTHLDVYKRQVESFTDDYQKVGAAYQEAMGVLVGVGIIDGIDVYKRQREDTMKVLGQASMVLPL